MNCFHNFAGHLVMVPKKMPVAGKFFLQLYQPGNSGKTGNSQGFSVVWKNSEKTRGYLCFLGKLAGVREYSKFSNTEANNAKLDSDSN